MKISPKLKFLLRKRHRKGFALIATVTLMLLLSLLCVGLMALATSQIKIADSALLNSEARAQCLLALDMAMADLQANLGSDQRVSAYSGILDLKTQSNFESGGNSSTSFNPYILGVWNSWDAYLTGKSKLTGLKISETYDAGRSKQFRRWLISSTHENQLSELDGVKGLGQRKAGRVLLLGEGTLGKSFSKEQYIYADLIKTPVRGQNEGYFAWWIGGENQKAKISLENEDAKKRGMDESFDTLDTTDVLTIQRLTWNTPRPETGEIEGLKDLPSKPGERSRILSLNTLPLVTSSTQDGHPYYFDVTTSSITLPVNVKTGGLKQDLNLLLTKQTLASTEFARRSASDCPLFEDSSVQKGTEPNMPIGSWQVMHSWYHLWPGASNSSASGDRTAGLIGTMNNIYTSLGGGEIANGANQSIFDNKTGFESGDNKAGYARTPVILGFFQTFGLVTEPWKLSDSEPKEQLYKLGMCYSPMFLWWNPYNVPMRIKTDKLYTQSIPYKSFWLQSYSINQQANVADWKYTWSTYAMTQGNDASQLGQDYGNYFRKSLDGSDDIIFAPGEIVFFSHAQSRKQVDYGGRANNPWAEGYHPQAVAGYKAHFYGRDGGYDKEHKTSASNIDAGKFYLRLRLGKNGSGSYTTDGVHFTPGRTEAITLLDGYGGMVLFDPSSGGTGKMLQSPQRFCLGWYDPADEGLNTTFCDETINNARWSTQGDIQNNPDAPYFIAAAGIGPKTAGALDTRIYQTDYRAKAWQHSSPAFWGSVLVQPDEQRRQYHPYQLATLPAGTGMSMCPIQSIGRNGTLGVTQDGEQVSFASVLELPVHPPFSLAGFAGMRLTPGWFDTSGNTAATLRRQQYQSGVPGVGIGASFADPAIPADQVYQYNKSNIPGLAMCGRIFDDFFDHGFLINDALWDRFFCSSISDMPQSVSSTSVKKADDVAREFFKEGKHLPVRRYIKAQTGIKDDDILKDVLSDEGWKGIAQYILIDGGFNINSTSVNAWYALLQGLQNRKLVGRNGDALAIVEPNKKQDDVVFSRFGTSTTTKSLESFGSYDPMKGADFRNKGAYLTAWGEVRKLSSAQLRKLAEQIVVQVKKRGPFLNMADFVNRRLDAGDKTSSLSGTLQAAIDATDINSMFNRATVPSTKGDLYKFPEAENGSVHTAAPGYLVQSDILTSIGNVLTVRDDTFTIRAYGCVKDKTGKRILSQAWCEATVQRCIEYVDSANNVEELPYKDDGTRTENITDVNLAFGRKFRIVSFRWLDAAEV